MLDNNIPNTKPINYLSYFNPRILAMLFLGFSAGLPILLIFSSLSLWLREAGVERSAVTYFSWAALGYSFKFIWAPLVDRLPIPFLTHAMGRRRSWLLISQISIGLAIVCMAMIDPSSHELAWMAYAAVFLGFSSATQDIVIDAYRIEAVNNRLQAMMSSMYIAGYRIGMLAAGAGALFIADNLGSSMDSYSYAAWKYSYLAMAALMLIGMVTTALIKEPETATSQVGLSTQTYMRFMSLFVIAAATFIFVYRFQVSFIGELKNSFTIFFSNKTIAGTLAEFLRLSIAIAMSTVSAWLVLKCRWVEETIVKQTYVQPIADFFLRYGIKSALLLLLLIGLYRISDIVLGVISNVFYQDLGFSKTQIATIVKSYGLAATIVGGFLGGVLAIRYGVMRVLMLGAILAAATNFLFMWLASSGADVVGLYIVITADNLSAGLASAAFVAFLSSLTNISFTAMQYAIFSSLMTLIPKGLGGYSGTMVDSFGYSQFFMITALLGLPVILLIAYIQKTQALDLKFDLKQENKKENKQEINDE